jgi:hypothetical protein
MSAEQPISSRDFIPHPERPERHPLVIAAIADALSRLPEDHSSAAEFRVVNGIEKRLAPAIMESEAIAKQINSPEYLEEIEKTRDYLECAIVGAVVCPDGRIAPIFSLGAPKVMTLHQRLAAKPEVRPSTSKKGAFTINDPDLTSSLVNSTEKKIEKSGEAELVQFMGVHINSEDPVHGCGAMGIEIGKTQLLESGMKFGGIEEYYKDLGEGFFAFNTAAETVLKIPAITFDIAHDIYSQGLIFGLRDAHERFDKSKSLRENLIELHHKKQVVMTELLDPVFRERILALDEGGIDPFDYNLIANNLIRIEKTARALAQQEEKTGFSFIPEALVKDASPVAKRVLGYTLIRNIVYRTLAEVEAGNHPLIQHNERMELVGPVSLRNIASTPFVLRTPHGVLRQDDIDSVVALETILRGALRNIRVKPEEEATIIVVGETFNPALFVPESRQAQKNVVHSTVGNEAARIRIQRQKDVDNGNTVVLAALFGPDKTFSEIVK